MSTESALGDRVLVIQGRQLKLFQESELSRTLGVCDLPKDRLKDRNLLSGYCKWRVALRGIEWPSN